MMSSLQRVIDWLFPNKLDAWEARDRMLLDQWWAALGRHNRDECERMRGLMNNNWREYREATNSGSEPKSK